MNRIEVNTTGARAHPERMPPRLPSSCPQCGTITTGDCPTHPRPPRPRKPYRAKYHGSWPTEAKARIAAHRANHGDLCPGWARDPHPIDPTAWTCDHDLGPLCRSCNSRKGATIDKERARGTR